MGEFWSLLRAVGVRSHGTKEEFDHKYSLPIAEGMKKNTDVLKIAVRDRATTEFRTHVLGKHFLRRTKQMVTLDLPGKRDRIVVCPLSKTQKICYENLLASHDVLPVLCGPAGAGRKRPRVVEIGAAAEAAKRAKWETRKDGGGGKMSPAESSDELLSDGGALEEDGAVDSSARLGETDAAASSSKGPMPAVGQHQQVGTAHSFRPNEQTQFEPCVCSLGRKECACNMGVCWRFQHRNSYDLETGRKLDVDKELRCRSFSHPWKCHAFPLISWLQKIANHLDLLHSLLMIDTRRLSAEEKVRRDFELELCRVVFRGTDMEPLLDGLRLCSRADPHVGAGAINQAPSRSQEDQEAAVVRNRYLRQTSAEHCGKLQMLVKLLHLWREESTSSTSSAPPPTTVLSSGVGAGPRAAPGSSSSAAPEQVVLSPGGTMAMRDQGASSSSAGAGTASAAPPPPPAGNVNNKVLVFSRSTKLLDIIQQTLAAHGFRLLRLDGRTATKERQQLCKAFNEDPHIFVFLISTRAGGVGLNLTAANKVVIFDPDWNPCLDLQAQDRCFRIGQTRFVEVFRLLAEGTVEEHIYLRQLIKQQVTRVTIDSVKSARRLTTENLEGLDRFFRYEQSRLTKLIIDDLDAPIILDDAREMEEHEDNEDVVDSSADSSVDFGDSSVGGSRGPREKNGLLELDLEHQEPVVPADKKKRGPLKADVLTRQLSDMESQMGDDLEHILRNCAQFDHDDCVKEDADEMALAVQAESAFADYEKRLKGELFGEQPPVSWGEDCSEA